MIQNIPENVRYILKKIEENGFEAYIVGGCVRDILLGKIPHDFDVTTNALPEDIKRIFPKTADTGIKHGTVTVISDNEPVEVTTFRTESGYSDYRHPENVVFVSDIKEDLKRRDFTVNAMAYSEKTGLVDYFGGKDDLKNKILRAVGNPEERFTEDALRILRFYRFLSVLEFSPEKETAAAAIKLAANLHTVSCERIAAELKKAVNGKNIKAFSPLIKSGALNFLFISHDKLNNIETLSSERLRMFAFLYLCSTSCTETAELLKLSNKERQYISEMCELLAFDIKETDIDIKHALHNCSDIFTDYLEFLHFNTGKNTENYKKIYDRIIENREPYRIKDLKITGDDLIKEGFSGRKIGFILNLLLEKVIEDPSLNKKDKLLKIINN